MGAPAWPADKVERWSIEKLIPYARNARTHSDEQIAQIAASIREWGWTNPVLVDEEGTLIAGHGRVLAARTLGVTSVPVMVARGWSEAQRRAYTLADNKLALNAGWDSKLLQLEVADLEALGFNMHITGFSDDDLLGIHSRGNIGLTDPDQTPEVPEVPVSVLGDVWLLGKHRLVCGDATSTADVGRALNGAKPLLMVTDPPYGVNYDPKWRSDVGVASKTNKMGKVLNDDRADWREAWALFPGDVAYVWHAGLFAREVQNSLEACKFKVRSQIIWAKDRFALSRGHYHWQHEPCWFAVREGDAEVEQPPNATYAEQHESCWYAVRGTGHWSGGRVQSTLWQIKAREDGGFGHGTQKPVECMRRPIENNSKPGHPVYEPFSGSGTTIIAGEMTGRRICAIELNPAYVDVGVKRWQDFTGEAAKLESSGATFEEVAVARKEPAAA